MTRTPFSEQSRDSCNYFRKKTQALCRALVLLQRCIRLEVLFTVHDIIWTCHEAKLLQHVNNRIQREVLCLGQSATARWKRYRNKNRTWYPDQLWLAALINSYSIADAMDHLPKDLWLAWCAISHNLHLIGVPQVSSQTVLHLVRCVCAQGLCAVDTDELPSLQSCPISWPSATISARSLVVQLS